MGEEGGRDEGSKEGRRGRRRRRGKEDEEDINFIHQIHRIWLLMDFMLGIIRNQGFLSKFPVELAFFFFVMEEIG